MTIANVLQSRPPGLPQALRTAQATMHLPEVQEMLCGRSAYNLGIFMPHRHNDPTVEFQPLPDNVMQVESGLEVSFQTMDEIAHRTDRFLPVGWCWRACTSTPLTACEMVSEEGYCDADLYIEHRMIKDS